jgi:ankyrin repeat protein
MTEQTSGSARTPLPLPEQPNLEWLRKQAKRKLAELRNRNQDAQLADAQFELAREYGFASWRALKSHIDGLTVAGQLVDAARNGNTGRLSELLDRHPDQLHLRTGPYDWTLLHVAAHNGQLAAVELLLQRGFDANTREKGDNTYALHWAAAVGRLDIVQRLADAGGDVIGQGDDHQLEVIGWATCWDGCDDAAHRAVAEFLISRGAQHHIFSAIALNLAEEVRRIVNQDPAALHRRMSRNEDHQLPLHFAVRMNRPEMVRLLIELGADPLAVDASGQTVAAYATAPDIDRPVMEKIRAMTASELVSAERGQRAPRSNAIDLMAALTLSDWKTAERLVREQPHLLGSGDGANSGVLHLMAKRNDVAAVKWLLAQGADPNARWAHWDSMVTPLHLAILGDHTEMVRLLLAAGADPGIKDSKHGGDALDWARFFERADMIRLLTPS